MSVVILCLRGQPAVVRETPTVTSGPAISIPRIMFSETRSRPISGSLTSLKASRIPASENPSAGSARRTVHELFCRLGLEMRRPINVVRWPGLTPAKPVNHVF